MGTEWSDTDKKSNCDMHEAWDAVRGAEVIPLSSTVRGIHSFFLFFLFLSHTLTHKHARSQAPPLSASQQHILISLQICCPHFNPKPLLLRISRLSILKMAHP